MNNQIANLIEKKACTKCGKEKLISEFHIQSSNQNGLDNKCKECHNEYNKKYNLKNGERLLQEHIKFQLENPIGKKKCSCCKEVKSISEFSKSKITKDGFYCQCKKCWKRGLTKNTEKRLQAHKKFQEENPIEYKDCCHCKQKKSVSEFFKDKTSKDGLTCQCKSCVKEVRHKSKEKLFQVHKKHQEENPIEEKYCSRCNIKKSITEFYKCKKTKDGLNYWCKNCMEKIKKKNKEKLLQDHIKFQEEHPIERKKCCCCKEVKEIKEFGKCKDYKDGFDFYCKSCTKKSSKKYRLNNPGKHKQWKKNNPEKVKANRKKEHKKTRSTFMGKLNDRMSSGVNISLRGNKKGRHWETLVKYTLEELKVSLKSKFTPYMNWENIGNWDIDHDFCKSRLIFDSAEDPTFLYLWSLDNLQPLWHSDNLLKGDMTPWEWKEFKKKYPKRLFNPEKFYKLPTTE